MKTEQARLVAAIAHTRRRPRPRSSRSTSRSTGALAAGRRAAHAGRRRALRPALGHGARLVRLVARRHARIPRLALPAARLGAPALRRELEARQPRHREAKARSTSSRCGWCRRSRSSSINLLMGLTPMRTRTFYWVSQLGMLAGTHRLRERGHAARAIQLAARHPVAGPDRRVRAARLLPARWRRRSLDAVQGARASTRAGRGRGASTATWS